MAMPTHASENQRPNPIASIVEDALNLAIVSPCRRLIILEYLPPGLFVSALFARDLEFS